MAASELIYKLFQELPNNLKFCRKLYKQLKGVASIFKPGKNILEVYNILVQVQFDTRKTKLRFEIRTWLMVDTFL